MAKKHITHCKPEFEKQVYNKASNRSALGWFYRQIRDVGQMLLRGMYPPTCVLCGRQGMHDLDICEGCLADLPWNRPACTRCAMPLQTQIAGIESCGHCIASEATYDRIIAILRYETPLQWLVAGGKYHARMNRLRVLGLCLARQLSFENTELPEVLIPVPMDAKRLRQRGHNHAVELARILGAQLGIRVLANACIRIKSAPTQAGLSKHARQRNLKGAFKIRKPIKARHVAIVDDVVTTGSTVEALARLLSNAGIARIDIWAVARTV